MSAQIIQLDANEWRNTLAQISGRLNKSFADVLNRSVASILFKAARLTPASLAAVISNDFIEHRIVEAGVYKTGKRRGMTRYRTLKRIAPRAYAIYRVAKKDRVTKGEELYQRVKQFVARRVASAGYLRYSWYAALPAFRKYTKLNPRSDRSRFSKRQVTIAKPANLADGWSAIAEVENRATVNNPTAMPILESALRQAIDLETAQLKRQLERLIARDIARAVA